MLKLLSDTPREWVDMVFSDFNSFLLDHASCERKASATNMSFVVKYPNRIEIMNNLIKMALEELEHFQQVYQIIEKRGLQLTPDVKDEYVNLMLKNIRTTSEERFMDRLILSGVIEARGCERLGLVAKELKDPELKEFYTELTKCEAKHHSQFIHMAYTYFENDAVDKRHKEFLEYEAKAISSVPIRPILH